MLKSPFIEHVINVRERLSEMRDIVGKNLTDKPGMTETLESAIFRLVMKY